MHIVGTAGHVDHGKSSLVAALTGTNPDRWLEERLRGMTLDLGFAHLRFDDGTEAGIVDVPGHERFLHNMLAGAAGMDLLLLAVAADEGAMPQTLEHLQILRFLNVRRTLVVLTKSDLLDGEALDFAAESVTESLRGTIAAGAPLIAVSTVTGNGMDALRAMIHSELRSLPARNAVAPAYLPIDRVFALPGHGTIVTGTLLQGSIAVGDRVKLEPSGKIVRVRSLQTFGRRAERANGGSRVAANLPGVEVHEIARGEVLGSPQFDAADAFDVRFEALPQGLPILRRRNHVRAYIGSAEILGTLLFEEPPADETPVPGRLFLRGKTVAYPGTAFVVRRISPKTLLGGGRVEGASGAVVAAYEPVGTQDAAVLGVLRAHGLEALEATAIAREANLREDAVGAALGALLERGDALRVQRPVAFVEMRAAQAFLDRVLAHLGERHEREPWSMGMTTLALSRALAMPETLLVRLLAAFADDGRIANRAGYYCRSEHTPKLAPAQRALFDAAVPVDPAAPFAPASLADVVARVKQSRVEGIGAAFETLVAKGALVKVGECLYRGTQIAEIHAKVETFIRAEKQMTMAQFRDLLGTSRKFAVPLLEWCDSHGITVRSGDVRVLRARRQKTP